MNKLLKKRFDELAEQAEKVEATKRKSTPVYGESARDYVDSELLLTWTVKTQDTLSKVCGNESQHFIHFAEAEEGGSFRTNFDNFKRMKAVFNAAKEDFEGGYLASAHDLVRAEVFSSELEQASELLKSGYATAAAVIAGAVLETAMRELCNRHNIQPAMLGRMNDDLAKAGVYNTIIQKQMITLTAIRNSAAHGNQGEFTAEQVKSMIADIERFLSQHLA
jgi:hypothetical protein